MENLIKEFCDVIEYISHNTPRKPILKGELIYHCPNCDKVVGYVQMSYIEGYEHVKECKHCKQQLNW